MFPTHDRYRDETCLFGVHSSCVVVELCFRRVHIGKRRCCRLPRESNVSTFVLLFCFVKTVKFSVCHVVK